jgi:hypothetical protein
MDKAPKTPGLRLDSRSKSPGSGKPWGERPGPQGGRTGSVGETNMELSRTWSCFSSKPESRLILRMENDSRQEGNTGLFWGWAPVGGGTRKGG